MRSLFYTEIRISNIEILGPDRTLLEEALNLLLQNINSSNGTLQVAPLAQTWFIRCRASHRVSHQGRQGGLKQIIRNLGIQELRNSRTYSISNFKFLNYLFSSVFLITKKQQWVFGRALI